MSAAAFMSSRMRACVFVDGTRSASGEAIAGSLSTSNGRVSVWSFARIRTVNLPGAAIGPTIIACSMPQCTIGRVSFPLNLGSSQMCGLSGGVRPQRHAVRRVVPQIPHRLVQPGMARCRERAHDRSGRVEDVEADPPAVAFVSV